FTRPKPMKRLAKLGFSQSYTYFTWRHTKTELTDYLTELALGPSREYMRPNFFVNTPDILTEMLQRGGRPAFLQRLVLAATLAPTWGMYSGFELCENRALPNSEEYEDSEKYKFKVWDWDRPGHIKDWVGRLNQIRRVHAALQHIQGLRFLSAGNGAMLFYARYTPDFEDVLAVAVNLDPFHVQEGPIEIPGPELGLGEDFTVNDLLAGPRGLWRGRQHWLRLDPQEMPAVVLELKKATSN
ncbi:MAG: alpha-1,4-glucan--maltose-1-phosphate maltosyltransferase, partial [Terriglobales bacterium]